MTMHEARGSEECELKEMSISVQRKLVFELKACREMYGAADDGRCALKLRPWIEDGEESTDQRGREWGTL